jgi:hypothetical protein
MIAMRIITVAHVLGNISLQVEVAFSAPALTSSLHAASAVAVGLPLVDPQLEAAMEVPARQLASEVVAAGLPADRYWQHLIALSATIPNPRQLVQRAIVKSAGNIARMQAAVAIISAAVAGVEAAFRAALPTWDEELALRCRPLMEQWEARGPGMLRQMALTTEEGLIPPRCDVVLVYPVLGGAGEAHLAYNLVRIEAVLANPIAQLPEVVRLAWLIGQLQLDLPVYSEHVHLDRLPQVARLAMLPVTLAAAEYVELAKLSPQTVSRAIDAWRLTTPPGVDGAAAALHWWQTYLETRPPWPVALAALDQMLG